ncbi:MAG TPA: chloride channel protein [Polyangiaceae bacterium]|nr:chloride channel protein [Polyangiaceae bacterium]
MPAEASRSLEPRARFVVLLQWLALGAGVGAIAGAASALFLWLLDVATHYRSAHEWIVFLLPLAGLAIGFVYERFGQSIKGGNNLVIDTIHDQGPEIPLRMAPMVLFGTVLTHLFGGSAGREGTAVQMGASLGDWVSHRLGLPMALRTEVLAAGVAGGFGSVFGTPVAGALFGLEFVVLGRIEYRALVPALSAALTGDLVTRALGIVHTPYPAAPVLALSLSVLARWLVFAAAVALTGVLFIELLHVLKRLGERFLPRLGWRMAAGGVLLVLGWQAVGTSDYLGLGVPMIVRAFVDPALPEAAFAAKLGFTALTLGAGFLGGEVTPLFFIGAALGNVLARLLGLPLELGAGVGLAALFAVCSNTPLALSVMAVELLGAGVLPHVLVVSALAYVLVGHRGIYPAQRLLRAKSGAVLPATLALRDAAAKPRPADAEDAQGTGGVGPASS